MLRPDLLNLVIAAFACFRIAELIAVDDGPFDVCLRFRTLVGVYDRDQNGEPATWHGKLFHCPYCVGMWIAAALALVFPMAPVSILLWLAIAGGQALLQSIGGRLAN